MTTLRSTSDGRTVDLAVRTLVGSRRAEALLWIKDTYVSGVHAQLRFAAGRWYLQDLGSLNGTWINGRRVRGATNELLQIGDTVVFGPRTHEGWVLEGEEPPQPFLFDRAKQERHCARDGRIELPDGRVLLIHGDYATFLGDDLQVLEDGQVEPEGGLQLFLPSDSSTELAEMRFSVDQLILDVEFAGGAAGVTLRQDGYELSLGHRSPWKLLFFLAEQRWSDRDDLGWMDVGDLAEKLDAARGTLDAWTHLIRREMATIGVVGGERIVEATERRGRRVGVGRDRLVVRG